jgi:hypothetical protein
MSHRIQSSFIGIMVSESHSAPLESKLIELYKENFEISDFPDWAFPSQDWDYSKTPLKKPFPPSIPFIGKNYNKAPKKIALYASAENLAHYERRPETIPEFLCDERAWNRHREANLEGWDKFFPRLHIGPIENGSLLCAAQFICNSLDLHFPKDPSLFLENLVVGNVGKFSIAGNQNKDHAGSINILKLSLPYFQIDLEILKPEILILPKTIYAHKMVKNLISEVLPEVIVIPAYQFNARVVNTHLKRNSDLGAQLANKWKGTILDEWTNHLIGYAKGSPYWYYAELKKELFQIENQNIRL